MIYWVSTKADNLRALSDYEDQAKQLLYFLDQAKEGILDFTATEIEVLTLLIHCEFYQLENQESPEYKRASKKFYIDKIKSIVSSGGQISCGRRLLSSIVSDKDLRKIIIKMEKDL